jgi:YesN/AraC family two-component response regulator
MEGTAALSVLLVEDDQDAREILSMMLRVRFPKIVFHLAENGKTGLESFTTHRPAIIITDVNMPVMNGICLAEAAKRIDPGVKVVLLTAFSDKTILESSQAAGVEIDHCLFKPVDYRKLLVAIQQCLGEIAPQASSQVPRAGKV